MHTYIWDLDRTYLQTDIRSVRGLVRSALEAATDKRTVPGADALLRGLSDHDPEASVTVVSGSPTQMREVLEAKLALDGVRVDRLILKDNLRNLRRGRFRAVRGQLGYKLPALLAHRLGQPAHARETLFGDDAEVDALIYALYAEVLAGRVDEDEMVRVMTAGGSYEDQIDHAVRSLRRLSRVDVVDGVFIRVDEHVPLSLYRALGRRVDVVFDWSQAALVLAARGRIPWAGAVRVQLASAHAHPWGVHALVGWVQDAVRRRLVTAEDALQLFEDPALHPALSSVQTALDLLPDDAPPAPSGPTDWEGFLRRRATVGTASAP